MAYRCQSCGHFCGLDDPQLGVGQPEFDGNTVEVDVEAEYPSTCCGDIVATASYTATAEVTEFPHKPDCKTEDATYDCDAEDTEPTDRFQDKDRHGKPITRSRYQRHYYGVEVSVNITCATCGASLDVTADDESGPPDEY